MKHEHQADVVIIGGGTGGFAAALAAAKAGSTVLMTEETSWIGGQLTSQAVPPDEHPWIEQFGCTRSYREYRERVRSYYRNNFPLTTSASKNPMLNPGAGMVSRLCHEPRASLAVLNDMIAPYVHSGKVRIMTGHVPVEAQVDGDRIRSVTVRDTFTGEDAELTAPLFIDATECGDLLPLTGTEYVTGAESQAQTGEPHALPGEADPSDMQAFTYCFAMDYIDGAEFTITRPEQYSFWRDYAPFFWPGKLLSWTGSRPITLEPVNYQLFRGGGGISLWEYRRIIAKEQFAEGTYPGDISLVNWPQNDYWLGNIIDVDEEEKERHLYMAKQLSFSLQIGRAHV